MKYLSRAVDTVRTRRAGRWPLPATRFSWNQVILAVLRGEPLRSPRGPTRRPLSGDSQTARAWVATEGLSHFWSYTRRGWGEKHWSACYFSATHSRVLQPVIDATRTLKRHEAGLMSYFAHRVSYPGAEGLNSPSRQFGSPLTAIATRPKTSAPGRAGAIHGPGSTRRAFTAAVRPLMNDSDGNSTHCRRGWALRDAI